MNKHDLSCEYFSRYVDAYKDGAIDVLHAIQDYRGGMTGEDWRDLGCELLSNFRDNIIDLFFHLFEWDDGEDGNGHIRESLGSEPQDMPGFNALRIDAVVRELDKLDRNTSEKESKLSARIDMINKKIDILAKANNIIFTDDREGRA